MTGDGHLVDERAQGLEEVHLPGPSVWPVVCAAGVTLIAFGVVTHVAFSVVGLLVMARALAGWVQEMRYD